MAKKKISDFRPQSRNANKHTQRGLGMLDQSIATDGWIGAITTAADGETFDGSARLETVYTRLGEEVEPIVVEADGTRPVIVKRVDIPTAQDERAKRLAIAANRIAQVDLDWDAEVLAELNDEIDLSGLFNDDELQRMIDSVATDLTGIPADNKDIDEDELAETNCECPKCGFTWKNPDVR